MLTRLGQNDEPNYDNIFYLNGEVILFRVRIALRIWLDLSS